MERFSRRLTFITRIIIHAHSNTPAGRVNERYRTRTQSNQREKKFDEEKKSKTSYEIKNNFKKIINTIDFETKI